MKFISPCYQRPRGSSFLKQSSTDRGAASLGRPAGHRDYSQIFGLVKARSKRFSYPEDSKRRSRAAASRIVAEAVRPRSADSQKRMSREAATECFVNFPLREND